MDWQPLIFGPLIIAFGRCMLKGLLKISSNSNFVES